LGKVSAQRDLTANNSPKRPSLKKTPEPNAFKTLESLEDFPPLSDPAVPFGGGEEFDTELEPAEGEASGRDPPRHRAFSKTHSKKNKSHASGAPPQGYRPAVVPVKIEPKLNHAELPKEFVDEITAANPDLLASLKSEEAEQNRTWFSVEICATPSLAWKTRGEYADLHDYTTERGFVDLLASAAQIGADHVIRLESLRALSIEGNVRKKFFYKLQCTSEDGLKNTIISPHVANYLGYSITFFQDQSSILGVRHQMSLVNLPEPFKHYTTAQFLRVLTSQNWDLGAVEHIQMGTRISPGNPKKMTGMLDIFVKEASIPNHGSEGALANAGTEFEILAKSIAFPPPSVVLGYNPILAVKPLMEKGMLMGQYITPNPSAGLSNLMKLETGYSMNRMDYGKTYLRQIIKPGHCKYCWGQKHSQEDECLYKGFCRVCLTRLKDMPNNGFHHACGSFIQSTPKPDKEEKADRKRSYKQMTAPTTGPYIPSK